MDKKDICTIKKGKINNSLLIYIFLFVELLPYLKTGYVGDDILNSLLRGECINKSFGFLEMLIYYILYGLKRGRCYFIAEILAYTIHYYVTNRVVYKLVILCFTLLSIKAAERFIRYHFQSEDAARLFLILCTALFPIFYAGSNSLMMYQGFMQTEVILFFCSLYFLEKYLLEGNKRSLLGSVLLYTCSLFVYEISYLYILGIAAVYYCKRTRSEHKIFKYYMIPFCIGLAANIVCRFVSANYFSAGLYDGVTVSMGDFGQAAKTFLIQFLGGISFFHYWIDEGNGQHIKVICVASIFSATLFLVLMLGYIRGWKKRNLVFAQVCYEKVLMILGCLLWFGCAGLIAVTEKYQRELLDSHYPHIPAYIEYFGMILLIFGVCMYFIKTAKNSGKVKGIVCTFVVLAGCMNYAFGTAHVKNYQEQTEEIYVNMPEAYAQAIASGLLDKIDSTDTIIIDISYAPVIYNNLFAYYVKKPVKAERLDVFIHAIDKNQIINGMYYPQNTYITKYFKNEDQTVIYLDQVESIQFGEEQDNILDIKTSDIFAWCKSNNEITGLYTTQNGQVQTLSMNDCLSKTGKGDYCIQAPKGLYDYYSYTFWQ